MFKFLTGLFLGILGSIVFFGVVFVEADRKSLIEYKDAIDNL